MASESSHHCYWQMEFDLNKAFHVHWKKCLVFPAEKLDISRWRLNLVGFNPVLQIAPKSLPFVLQRPPGSGLLHRNLDSVWYYSICSLSFGFQRYFLCNLLVLDVLYKYTYIVQIVKKYKYRMCTCHSLPHVSPESRRENVEKYRNSRETCYLFVAPLKKMKPSQTWLMKIERQNQSYKA